MSRTPTTPADIAEHLTGGDNDYTEDLEGWPCLSAEGNVLSIKLVLADKESPAELFEAHVFAVEKPVPVASEPVKLPVELAKDLTYNGPDGPALDGWKCVALIAGEERRSARWYDMVIQEEATGAYYLGAFLQGMGDVEYPQAWDENEPVFEPVVPRVTVVRSVEWVKPSAADAGGVS
ncbi:hypothetical protein [Acrocarpospora sp. B8E8]|uniref:hypothetical protein n=1 Tax=Acrocarpospora sp. B8E8 TaxID=3153572 RepID=UPI00325DFB8E